MTIFYKNVYINDKYTYLASNKYDPVVLNNVDCFINDYYLNEKCFEVSESKFIEKSILGLLDKSKLSKSDISMVISGDLQNQILSSTLSNSNIGIPFLGVYSACASLIEGIIIASSFIDKDKSNIIVSTSSHNLVSEKQFRFPIEYGALRKKCNGCTASGSVSVLLSNRKSNIRVESSTIGRIYQTNHKDSNDMGSAMAISCAQTIYNYFKETKRNYDYYDLILTGDLGIYGSLIMKKYFYKISGFELENVIDSGSIFYSKSNNYCGASGPVCIGFILFDYILKKYNYKKILVVGTGSLHSLLSSNLKIAMPSISHAISLEVK